ncbi:MAG: NUDIX hydrolase [Actinobacteria bacterium]|nr:NUDIX hydrolase [Actinomycetota bacterium]
MTEATQPRIIEAAGAIVWRGESTDPRIALVHRDRYNDWTFPKGKLELDEHPMIAAVREIHEEAGARIALGAPLPGRDYSEGIGRKHVYYWAGRYLDGEFTANEEVDEVRWLTIEQTRELMTYPADHAVLDAFALQPRDTIPLVLVRHAKAKSREEWTEDDHLRPLTARGSPWLRCMQTVSPYAGLVNQPLAELDVLGESEFEQDPATGIEAARQLIDAARGRGQGLIFCSHGNVIPALLLEALHGFADKNQAEPLGKGEFFVIHLSIATGQVVGLERHRP